ncbi:MAG: glycine--tRNA ligase subunit beta [Coriobacteriaceae bacterium]|nr:glycine--tRNA ligase subunit beta [Coriobacteriaceae bacterium]
MSRDLLFEIGVEEIPSTALYGAIGQLAAKAAAALKGARLGYEDLNAYGAPRRLVLRVTGLAERADDLSERVKGPSVSAAYDADGNPTKAGEGFARSRGVESADLETVEENGNAYVYAAIERAGLPAAEVLPGLLAELAAAIDWPKSMRWGSGEVRFSRPVRRLVALFGDDVVPVEYAGLTAGRVTSGHRFLADDVEIASASEYDEAAQAGRFVYDQAKRAHILRDGIEAAAAGVDGRAVVPEKTFAEVVNLVEWPTVVVGHFDAAFLEVPREVLETAMESHQRYFPVESADGELTNAFIVVHNGDPERNDVITAGHERVIRARLADAAFFYREDLKAPLEAAVPRLETIVFQEKLGTLGAKAARMEALAEKLARIADVDADAEAEAVRAAHLAKADLVSHAVVEFPSLQGVMGRYYALATGESPAVAEAIVEHYRPRYAGDDLPASIAGQLVSVADKLDTMVGIFAAGMPPTGSQDPYALRRGALGILGIITAAGLRLTLTDSIAAALEGYAGVIPGLDVEGTGSAVQDFVVGRLEGVLKDRGHAFDTVAAVLAVVSDDPADALARCEALTAFRSQETALEDLSVAFARAQNLRDPALGTETDPDIMGPEEAALAKALDLAENDVAAAVAARDYAAALAALAALRGPIDVFFAGVLVMAEDEALRANRLRLLNRFVAPFLGFADLGRLAV